MNNISSCQHQGSCWSLAAARVYPGCWKNEESWLCCHLPDRAVGCQEWRLAGNLSQGAVHFPSALVFREQAWGLGCPCDLARQDCGRGFLCSSAALEAKRPEKGCHRNPDCSLALTRSDLIRGFSGATQRSISIKMFQSFHWRHHLHWTSSACCCSSV